MDVSRDLAGRRDGSSWMRSLFLLPCSSILQNRHVGRKNSEHHSAHIHLPSDGRSSVFVSVGRCFGESRGFAGSVPA